MFHLIMWFLFDLLGQKVERVSSLGLLTLKLIKLRGGGAFLSETPGILHVI